MRLPFVAASEFVAKNDGGRRNESDDQQENERGAVLYALGIFVLRNLGADDVDVVRQRHDALEKEIAELRDLPRQLVAHHIGRSEHDRRRLARDARDAEDRRGQDAR